MRNRSSARAPRDHVHRDIFPRPAWLTDGRLLAALVVAVTLVQLWALTRPIGLATNLGGALRDVGDLADGLTVEQTFRPTTPGLDGVAIRFHRLRADGTGRIEVSVEDGGNAGHVGNAGSPRLVQNEAWDVPSIQDEGWQWIRFPSIDDSRDRVYRLRVTAGGAAEGSGITLRATRANPYRHGSLYLNGQEQWGDIEFVTSSSRATAWARLRHRLGGQPWPVRTAPFLALALLAFTLAFWRVVAVLIGGRDAARSVPRAQPAQPGQPARLELTRFVPSPFWLVTFLFACHVLLAMLVVPPWQNPDEPQHFELVRVLSQRDGLDVSQRSDPAVQAQVFSSMAKHGWWRHVRRPLPNPLPLRFQDEPYFAAAGTYLGMANAPPLYYALGSAWVGAHGADGLMRQYQALRGLSAILGVLTLWCVWHAARTLTPSPRVAPGACLLVALLPQFALNAISVNPDMLVNLLGAFAFWQLVRVRSSRRPIVSFALLVASIVAVVFTKRSGAPLAAFGVIGFVWLLARLGVAGRWRQVGLVAGGSVAAVLIGLVLFGGVLGGVLLHWDNVLDAPVRERAATFLSRFTWLLHDSAWCTFGWMAYVPDRAWVMTARLVTGAVAVMSVLGMVRAARLGASELSRALVLVLVLVGIQVLAIYVTYYPRQWIAQGRYLFPVVGPAAVMAWLAVRQGLPVSWRPVGHAVLSSVCFLLAMTAWMFSLVPAYAS